MLGIRTGSGSGAAAPGAAGAATESAAGSGAGCCLGCCLALLLVCAAPLLFPPAAGCLCGTVPSLGAAPRVLPVSPRPPSPGMLLPKREEVRAASTGVGAAAVGAVQGASGGAAMPSSPDAWPMAAAAAATAAPMALRAARASMPPISPSCSVQVASVVDPTKMVLGGATATAVGCSSALAGDDSASCMAPFLPRPRAPPRPPRAARPRPPPRPPAPSLCRWLGCLPPLPLLLLLLLLLPWHWAAAPGVCAAWARVLARCPRHPRPMLPCSCRPAGHTHTATLLVL
jgi:hypothetical protein